MPTLKAIALEWNRNATERCRQIDEGIDISHDRVLVPSVLRAAGELRGRAVLDVGCGCGFLTSKAARYAKRVLGIDISNEMIRQARLRHGEANLSFECVSLEATAGKVKKRFDVCLSNMSLITMPNLERALLAFANVIVRRGLLVFSVSHPCFWNFYRKDETAETFEYWTSHPVTAPFRITFDTKPLPAPTTYFHRSLSTYLSGLRRTGFELEQLIEPKPPKDVPQAYNQAFPLPRFLVFRARKS